MNVVLLVNSHNLPDIRAFVESAASLQTTKTNGAISVVYQQKLGALLIEELIAPLVPVFSAASTLPVPIAPSLGDDGRNATLFALFVAQVYARYPGPWLVVDGPGIPRVADFVTEVDKQHKILGGKCSGRASMQGDGITPVGPVVLGLQVKDLKWFSPGSNESWRARARFLLGRCGFRTVPLDEYLFEIPKASRAAPEPEKAPDDIPVIPPVIPAPPTFDPASLDAGQIVPEASEVASTQPSTQVDKPLLIVDEAEELRHEMAKNEANITPYDNLSDEDLRTQIEIRDLPKPHHFTKRPRLLSILCENDDARKAELSQANP